MAAVLQQPEHEVQKVLLTQGDLSEAPTPAPDQPLREIAPSVTSTTDHATTIATDELERKLEEGLRVDDDEDPPYVAPVEDPYSRAVKYLEKYNVMHVFQTLTANLVYHRPEDPLQFMLDEILKMQKDRAQQLSDS
ncbi:uncharacterized protein LOC144452120 [Glandiceps talaboti]